MDTPRDDFEEWLKKSKLQTYQTSLEEEGQFY
jgi:hypothetical protein